MSVAPRATGTGRAGEAGGPPAFPGAGTGTRLWLVRHAEVAAAWRDKVYGSLDVPLSEDGERRSDELAGRLALLGPALVLTSPLARARRLAEAAASGCGAPLRIEPGLGEADRGRWQGREVAELHAAEAEAVARMRADRWTFREHGGESDAMVAARASEALRGAIGDPLELRPGATIVVVSHENVIRILAALALGAPPGRSHGLRVDPARAALLVDEPGGWSLHIANAHDPAALADPAHAGGAGASPGAGGR